MDDRTGADHLSEPVDRGVEVGFRQVGGSLDLQDAVDPRSADSLDPPNAPGAEAALDPGEADALHDCGCHPLPCADDRNADALRGPLRSLCRTCVLRQSFVEGDLQSVEALRPDHLEPVTLWPIPA